VLCAHCLAICDIYIVVLSSYMCVISIVFTLCYADIVTVDNLVAIVLRTKEKLSYTD